MLMPQMLHRMLHPDTQQDCGVMWDGDLGVKVANGCKRIVVVQWFIYVH